MKARTAWLLALGAAVVAAIRLFRRPAAAPPAPAAPGPDPRAEQLREKLAESRAAVEEMEREGAVEAEPETEPEPAAGEPAPEQPAAESVEERRQRVHERGEATARKMRRPPEPPPRS